MEADERSLGALADALGIELSTASRNVDTLARHGLVASRRASRSRLLRLSRKGRAKLAAVHRRGDRVVVEAFELLTPDEGRAVTQGLGLFTRALARARQTELTIRPSRAADNPGIARVIRRVLEELGQANAGSAYFEATTDRIHDVYAEAGGLYLVVAHGSSVVGGAGLYPHTPDEAELKNMYFLPEARGGGHAKIIVNRLLARATTLGVRRVFLETHSDWRAAIRLYEQFGFRPAERPSYYRGHSLCDRFYALRLPLADSADPS